MASIKIKPIGIRDYYLNFKDVYARRIQVALIENDRLKEEIDRKRKELLPYVSMFKFPIIDYPEFQQNKYINGRLINAAIGLYTDRRNDGEMKGRCFKLLSLAKAQEKYYNNVQAIRKAEKILALTYRQYCNILRTFYYEVHKQMILNGYGYVLEGCFGWICFNRVIINGEVKMIDFAATNKKKKELIAKGLKPYNEKEAKWCKDNHIPYDGVDYKVYKNDECWYEYCLLGCRLPRSRSFVITNPDGRNMKYRGMTNEDIINKDNHDVNKILQEDLDIKTKLTLCLSVDKTLYTKFIRNENQTKCRIGKIDRQSR